jgi:hypothetical protein
MMMNGRKVVCQSESTHVINHFLALISPQQQECQPSVERSVHVSACLAGKQSANLTRYRDTIIISLTLIVAWKFLGCTHSFMNCTLTPTQLEIRQIYDFMASPSFKL